MKKFALLLLALFLFAGCGSGSDSNVMDDIQGAWEDTGDTGLIVTFLEDGTVTMGLGDFDALEGTYSVLNDSEIEMTLEGETETLTLDMPDQDTLVLDDGTSEGRLTFNRQMDG